MKLKCISGYENGDVKHAAGDVIEDSDEVCEFLLRDSPGSFEIAGKKAAKEEPAEDDAPDLSAMSTETETGIVAPDRRARGGAKR